MWLEDHTLRIAVDDRTWRPVCWSRLESEDKQLIRPNKGKGVVVQVP